MSSGLSLIALVGGIVSSFPVSGRRMQRFSQFRLGCHGLPIAVGRLAMLIGLTGSACLATVVLFGDEKHLVFECPALASLRQRHAGLFTSQTDTMRSFFAQQDHLGVFHYVIDCVDFMQI